MNTNKTTQAPAADLSGRAVLAALQIKEWRPKRICKPAGDTVSKAFNAAEDAGAYTKNLISRDAIADLRQIRNSARATHYELTLPWGDAGERLLPNKAINLWEKKMQTARRGFEAALKRLVADWPKHVAEAQKRLGRMYDAHDYPSAAELADAFDFAASITPIADPGDIRVKVSAEAAQRIADGYRAAIEERADRAQGELLDRVRDAVTHAARTLANPDKGFHKTLLGHLADLGRLVPDLDLTADPALAALAGEMAELGARDVQTVKNDPEARSKAAADAAAIAEKLGGIYGGAE